MLKQKREAFITRHLEIPWHSIVDLDHQGTEQYFLGIIYRDWIHELLGSGAAAGRHAGGSGVTPEKNLKFRCS